MYEMSTGKSQETEPKHLRVGVSAAMVEHAALYSLLKKKGLVTDEEYFEALAEFAEREVASYEARNPGVRFL